MVQLQRYLSKTSELSKDEPLPLLNSLFINRFGAFNPYSADNTFKTFMKWARQSPQLMSFLDVISTDILSDNISFSPAQRNNYSGKNKVLRSEKFWNANNGYDVAQETIYDMLINGIGYNWIGTVNEKQLKEICEKISINCDGIEIKAERILERIREGDEYNSLARKLRMIPASTVTIEANEYEPTKYIQRVGTNYKEFDPEEVIVFKLMPLDGKLYPFPPMEALLAEVYLLWLITQSYLSFFQNGGTPDKVFILPNEMANSKNHRYLVHVLQKYKKIQNQHGALVFTGDLKIEDLMKVESQMQYKDLSLYLVSVLAMMYGVPAGRIPFLLGKAANLGDAGGLADSGYWRKISVWQSKIETAYNQKLWIPYFGTKMKFARAYKQDEIRETSIEMQKNDVVKQRLDMGLWTIEEAANYLGIDNEILTLAQAQKKERTEEALQTDLYRQNESNDNALQEPDKKEKNKKKQDTQIRNKLNEGGKTIKP